jgi:uncharacterized protein with von Willebrand factor type A (vWA) domain
MNYLETLRHLADDSAYSVESSEWSRREWTRIKKAARELESLTREGEVELPNFSDLQCDAYHAFFRSDPEVKNEFELKEGAAGSAAIIRHMISLPDYKRLHGYTEHNEPASALAVGRVNRIVDDLPESVKEKIREQQEGANSLEEMEGELESLRGMWRDLNEDEGGEDAETEPSDQDAEDEEAGQADEEGEAESDGEGAEEGSQGQGGQSRKQALEALGRELATKVDQQRSQVSDLTHEMKSAMEEASDDIRGAVRGAVSETLDDIEELGDALSAYGCGSGPGVNGKVSIEDQMRALQTIRDDEQLRQIAEMAGRIEHIIKKTKQEKVASQGGGSIVNVELTGDLTRLLPSELMRLAHPAMKRELMMRLAERKALGWKKERKEKIGKGPIICCVDSSGSMEWSNSPAESPIIWAKAVALALYRECAERGVPFGYVHFSSGGRVDAKRFDARPGEELDLMKFSQIFHAGGTDYALALNACLEAFAEDGMEKADVVFISDGEYTRDRDWETGRKFSEKMVELGGKTLGIQIGGQFCEKPFGDFADGSWVLEMHKLREKGGDVPILKEMFTDFL